MQANSQAIQKGINILSTARSQIHSMCNEIEQAIRKAESVNKNKVFNQCKTKVDSCVKNMRASAEELCSIGKGLSALLNVINQLGE